MSTSSPTKTKKRVTKDEKIAQLKSELKLSKEENSRLKIQIQRLLREAEGGENTTTSNGSKQSQSNGSSNNNSSSNRHREEEQKKFREAMRAFKKVTVQQEICIKNLRNKASQKRKDIKQRDSRIQNLEQKVRSLETTNRSIQEAAGSGEKKDLHVKIKDLQLAYDELEQKKDRMKQILEEKQSKIESLLLQQFQQQQQQQQQQRTNRPLSLPKRGNNNMDDKPSDGESVGSVQSGSSALLSVSTESDFNVARLKTELAKKTEKILNLQMDLENVKDDLFQMKQQKRNSVVNRGGVGGDKNGNNNNNNHTSVDLFAGSGNFPFHRGDDWTDVDETDNESQFGDSFFPNGDVEEEKGEGDDDFDPSRDSFAAGFW